MSFRPVDNYNDVHCFVNGRVRIIESSTHTQDNVSIDNAAGLMMGGVRRMLTYLIKSFQFKTLVARPSSERKQNEYMNRNDFAL